QSAALTREALSNATYSVPDKRLPLRPEGTDRSITLKDGTFVESIGSPPDLSLLRAYIPGGDAWLFVSTDFVVLELLLTYGGSGTDNTLHVMTEVGGKPSERGWVNLGDNYRLESVSSRGHEVLISGMKLKPGDVHCCPTQPDARTYFWDGE